MLRGGRGGGAGVAHNTAQNIRSGNKIYNSSSNLAWAIDWHKHNIRLELRQLVGTPDLGSRPDDASLMSPHGASVWHTGLVKHHNRKQVLAWEEQALLYTNTPLLASGHNKRAIVTRCFSELG